MQECSSCQALLDMHPDSTGGADCFMIRNVKAVTHKRPLIDSLSRLRQNDLFIFWKRRFSELTINFFVVVAVYHQMY